MAKLIKKKVEYCFYQISVIPDGTVAFNVRSITGNVSRSSTNVGLLLNQSKLKELISDLQQFVTEE